MRFFRKSNGAVSIFLIIVLVPILLITSIYVDYSKVKLARGVIDSAGDLALNTALTDYDTKLKDLYGLFATAQDTSDLFDSLEDYFRETIVSSGLSDEEAQTFTSVAMNYITGNEEVSDLLGLELIDFTVSKFPNGNLANATVLEKQIVDFMKYRSPINTGLNFISSLKSFATLSKQTNLVEKRKEYYEEQKTLMEKAQEAWKYLHRYNNNRLIVKDVNAPSMSKGYTDSYFSDLKKAFDSYENQYSEWAKASVKDYYAAVDVSIDGSGNVVFDKDYSTFNSKYYRIGDMSTTELTFTKKIEEEVVAADGKKEKKTIEHPIKFVVEDAPFYISSSGNTDNGVVQLLQSALDAQKDSGKIPSVSNFGNHVNQYKGYYDDYKAAERALLPYSETTYGPQYLYQTNRRNLYTNWCDCLRNFHSAYVMLMKDCFLKKAESLGEEYEGNISLSETDIKNITGIDLTKYPYDVAVSIFDMSNSSMSKQLQKYANNLNSDVFGAGTKTIKSEITAMNTQIRENYKVINEYISDIDNARNCLQKAIENVQFIKEEISPDGELSKKQASWKTAADDKALNNTTLANQDKAEIDSLTKFINEGDVNKFLTRLNNAKAGLDAVYSEITGYNLYGTPISDIDNYKTFAYVVEQGAGKGVLLSMPLAKSEFDSKVTSLSSGKFTITKKVDISWMNATNSYPALAGTNVDKLSFYSFLYSKFEDGFKDDKSSSFSDADKVAPKENESGGKGAFNKIKEVGKNATDGNKGSAEELSGTKEIVDRPKNPSSGATGSAPGIDEKEVDIDNAASDNSSGLSSMFSGLGEKMLNLGEDVMEDLYVTDYVMSMFSYDTIEKEYAIKNSVSSGNTEPQKIQTLTLNPIDKDHNYAYRREVEYIIYGGKNSSNVTKAYASIFGIRFGFDVIYAFASSEVRDMAFAMATPISAATLGIIPVPLIQAIIIIAAACIQAGLDLAALREGKAVNLFHNNDSWQVSLSGLTKTAVDTIKAEAKNAAGILIDKGTARITQMLNMTDEELTKYIEENRSAIEKDIDDSFNELITRHVNEAIQALTTAVNEAIDMHVANPAKDMKAYVEEELDKWAPPGGDSSDLSYVVKRKAVECIKRNNLSESLINLIEKTKGNVDSTIEDAYQEIKDELSSIKDDLKALVSDGANEVIVYKGEVKKSINESIDKGAGEFKNTLSTQIDGMFGNSEMPEGDGTGMASLLSFTYSDYLKLFLFIGLLTNSEKAIVLRISDTVEANVAMIEGRSEFKMENAATYVSIDAEVMVKPTLLALPLFADVENNPASEGKSYSLKYYGVSGY